MKNISMGYKIEFFCEKSRLDASAKSLCTRIQHRGKDRFNGISWQFERVVPISIKWLVIRQDIREALFKNAQVE
jgi:hypothetical protein